MIKKTLKLLISNKKSISFLKMKPNTATLKKFIYNKQKN